MIDESGRCQDKMNIQLPELCYNRLKTGFASMLKNERFGRFMITAAQYSFPHVMLDQQGSVLDSQSELRCLIISIVFPHKIFEAGKLFCE